MKRINMVLIVSQKKCVDLDEIYKHWFEPLIKSGALRPWDKRNKGKLHIFSGILPGHTFQNTTQS